MINSKYYFDDIYIESNPELENKIITELRKRPLTSQDLSYYMGLDVQTILAWVRHLETKQTIREIDNGNIFYKLTKDLRNSHSPIINDKEQSEVIAEKLAENIISQTVFQYIGDGHFKPISNFMKISKRLRRGK